jgi:hypothetical protein
VQEWRNFHTSKCEFIPHDVLLQVAGQVNVIAFKFKSIQQTSMVLQVPSSHLEMSAERNKSQAPLEVGQVRARQRQCHWVQSTAWLVLSRPIRSGRVSFVITQMLDHIDYYYSRNSWFQFFI